MGIAPTLLENCAFTDCLWVLVEAATTLAAMARLYRGMIPDGAALIEQVLASIRQGSWYGTPYRPVS